jgi:hypothetical protein
MLSVLYALYWYGWLPLAAAHLRDITLVYYVKCVRLQEVAAVSLCFQKSWFRNLLFCVDVKPSSNNINIIYDRSDKHRWFCGYFRFHISAINLCVLVCLHRLIQKQLSWKKPVKSPLLMILKVRPRSYKYFKIYAVLVILKSKCRPSLRLTLIAVSYLVARVLPCF